MPFLWFKRRKKNLPSAIVDPEEGVLVQILPLRDKEVQSLSLSELDDATLRDKVVALFPVAFSSDASAYRILIPARTELPQTKETKRSGKKRAPLGMKGLPAFRNFEKMALPTGFTLAGFQSSLLSVASFAVGQYHMAQIKARLDSIDQKLSALSSFQHNEYQSRVLALLAQLKRSLSFQGDILSDPSARERELRRLDALEQECAELLGQANLSLGEIARQEGLSFSAYEESTKEAENWLRDSRALFSILRQIAKSEYLLGGGSIPLAQCEGLLPTYEKQCHDAYAALSRWHEENDKRLRIDYEKKRRERPFLVKGILSHIGLSKKAYQEIDGELAECLSGQRIVKIEGKGREDDPFHHDVSLIAKEGKLYYEEGKKSGGD